MTATVIDDTVLSKLARLVPELDEWVGRLEGRHAQERERQSRRRDLAPRERDDLARQVERAHKRWLGYGDADADLVLPALRQARERLADAETRLVALEDALAAIPEDTETNRLAASPSRSERRSPAQSRAAGRSSRRTPR